MLDVLCGRSSGSAVECPYMVRIQSGVSRRPYDQVQAMLTICSRYSGGLPDRMLFARLAPNAVPVWAVWIIVFLSIALGCLQFASEVAVNGEQ